MRAAEPRASSSASGFRFCGIMLEPGRVPLAELHEPELARPVEDQILGEPREVRADHRRGEQHLGDEVAVADGVDAVRRERVEAEACPGAARARSDTRSRRPRRSPAAGRPPSAAPRARRARSRSSGQKCESIQCAADTGLRALQVRVRRHQRRLERCAPGRSSPAAARARRASSCWHASIVQSRVAVATWSLRLRPVCSFDATSPTSSCSRRSISVCTSSSDALRLLAGVEPRARRRRARARSPCSPRA